MGFFRFLGAMMGESRSARAASFARAAWTAWTETRADPLTGLADVFEEDRRDHFEAVIAKFRREDEDAVADDILQRGASLFANDPFVLVWLARHDWDRGNLSRAEEHYRAAYRLKPLLETAAELADLLVTSGRTSEARSVLEGHPASPQIDLRIARAAFEEGKADEALARLDRAIEELDRQLKDVLQGDDRRELVALWTEVRALREEVTAEEHGREMAVVDDALAGRLDGRAGINYSLLGMSLMPRSPRRAVTIELATPQQEIETAGALLSTMPDDSNALARKGCAELRLGRLDEARKSFERAARADGQNFAAFLGLGATLDAEHERVFDRAKALPEREAPGLEDVVREMPVLTALEQRVVRAMAWPLRGALPLLRDARARMRILPIDARVTDVPELAEISDTRHDDHRTYDAITGLASDKGIALSKIESLLDVDSQAGSVFAHELAHLVHYSLPERLVAEIESLYEKSSAVPHVLGAYAQSNVYEFFACCYVDWIQSHYSLRTWTERDDEGIQDAIFSFFDRLAARDDLSA